VEQKPPRALCDYREIDLETAMTIRLTTTRAVLAITLAVVCVVAMPATPAAADREHQQIMADLRMLQEQTQQLQALLNGLGDALKAVNARLDDQTSLERKAFADGKVQMDAITGDIRVVREKVDETNVRLGSLSQELESLRLAIPEPAAAIPPPPMPGDVTSADALPPQPAAPAVPPVNPGISAQRLWQSSFADYTSGNYTLAVQGFRSYLDYFPKSAQAPEAQLYIGEAYFQDKKDADAVAAYERVIANYPSSSSTPQAYYKRGVALERLGELDRAKQSYETVVKQSPESAAGSLARQALDRLNRPVR
jgi:tol-pal system protein YbgF